MTDSLEHLTEEERQTLADGTLAPERADAVELHLRSCDSCSADVARIRSFMTRTREAPSRVDDPGELWPSIRARIDERKLMPIAPGGRAATFTARPLRPAVWVGALGALSAAAVITIAVTRDRAATVAAGAAAAGDERSGATPLPLIAAADSAHAYEEEARTLLARLELQRAVMRPEAARLLDRDTRTIDAAIAELKAAIAKDPNNPALRQLLASSYRQKVELLKRAGNAG
jgi:anti-sigma factor RsiW